MGHKHSRDEILAGALATAFDEGLSRLTFGRVAERLGINDRTVVYYFPTKDELITDVVVALGTQLHQTLGNAFTGRAVDHVELIRSAWPVLAAPEADPTFALFFEANGLAAAGREPYRTLVPRLVDAWISWLTEFVDGPLEHRRTEAETTIAVVEGLLLLRQLAGPDSADRAVARLTRSCVSPPPST